MPQQHRTIIEPSLLPDRFRQTGYMISEERSAGKKEKDGGAADLEALQLKVGSNITTTQPIPLREAMKAIVRTKNMSLSWAPDVDQELLVDIDVRSNDNFYEAIDNILRQLDYFQEVEGSTLVIKYRETKQYHIAMPFVKQDYKTATGSTSGAISSSDNKFDIWENIQKNIDSIIKTWTATVATPEVKKEPEKQADKKGTAAAEKKDEAAPAPVARRVSATDSTYTIDKPVGLITVNAPKSLQKRIDSYLANLEKELYKQIIIEAKIIEVALNDSSSLGINWNMLLQGLSLDGVRYGKTKSYNRSNGEDSGTNSSANFSDTTTDSTTNTNSTTGSTTNSTTGSTTNSTTGSTTNSNNLTATTNNANGTNINNVRVTGDKPSTTNTATVTGNNKYDATGVGIAESIAGSATGSTDGSTYGSADGSNSSSVNSVTRSISNTLTQGATAATFITTGSSMAEGFATGATLLGFNFTSFIKALQGQGQTSILSNPKISVMNGQPALISVGRNVTYIKDIKSDTSGASGAMSTTVTTADILSGIGLALSAVIKKDNEIVMNLVPITSELSEPIEYVEVGQGNKIGLPVVNKREMSTMVKIKDGSMLVVGGLISEVDSKSGEFLPGARNLPYLKYLFGYEEKSRKKRELIILLRPRIIN